MRRPASAAAALAVSRVATSSISGPDAGAGPAAPARARPNPRASSADRARTAPRPGRPREPATRSRSRPDRRPGTSEIAKHTRRPSPSAVKSPPPLIRETDLRTRLTASIGRPLPSSHWFMRRRSASDNPAIGTSTRLEAPPEIRKSNLGPLRQRGERRTSNRLPASRLPASGTTDDRRAGIRSQARRGQGIQITGFGDQQAADDMFAPSASQAPSGHRLRSLADRTDPNGPSKGRAASARRTTGRPSTARSAERQRHPSNHRRLDVRRRQSPSRPT
jgi:hypothetical protein